MELIIQLHAFIKLTKIVLEMSIHVVYVEIKKVIFQNVLICVNLVINQGLITTVNVIIAKNIYMIK